MCSVAGVHMPTHHSTPRHRYFNPPDEEGEDYEPAIGQLTGSSDGVLKAAKEQATVAVVPLT